MNIELELRALPHQFLRWSFGRILGFPTAIVILEWLPLHKSRLIKSKKDLEKKLISPLIALGFLPQHWIGTKTLRRHFLVTACPSSSRNCHAIFFVANLFLQVYLWCSPRTMWWGVSLWSMGQREVVRNGRTSLWPRGFWKVLFVGKIYSQCNRWCLLENIM